MSSNILHFCTLFDSNFLTRGLALYNSLQKSTGSGFILYILAFDDKAYDILNNLNLPHAVIISLAEFEDPELLSVKTSRTRQEYCWTCTSSLILYVIRKFNAPMCAYLDADMLFFDGPLILLNEMGNASILLTEHRLADDSPKISKFGRYCVQFMPFKNTEDGMRALNWWRERCLEWCYARVEDGKFGDQKYLDDWTERFNGVHVLENPGGGVAPWNMFRYKIDKNNEKLFLTEKSTGRSEPLVFYHFHSTKIFNIFGKIKAFFWPYDYHLSKSARKVYKIYSKALTESLEIIQESCPGFRLGFEKNHKLISYFSRKTIKDIIQLIIVLARPLLKQRKVIG